MTSYHASKSFNFVFYSQHALFLELSELNLFQQPCHLSRFPWIHNVAGNGVFEHENIVKTLMVSVEKDDD